MSAAKLHQPYTCDTTMEGQRRARNAARERLALASDAEVHAWLCHPDGAPCLDGCDVKPSAGRLALYQSTEETL